MNLIIDGNHLAHRCRHSFSLSNKGVDVSVTYGFLRVLESLMEKFGPTSVLVCWDGGLPEFRRKAVPEYKANRDHGDPLEWEDFNRQMNELCDYALPLTGVLSVCKYGAEADDVMYQASRILVGHNIIVTGDKDLLQAVNPLVKVYNPGSEKLYGMQDVQDEFGINLMDYVDWRALQGDSSDNIPGVPGIGPKTATKLFEQWKSLTGITNAAMGRNPEGEIQGRIRDAINSFGFDRIARNINVMALYMDRTGSRLEVDRAVDHWRPYDHKRFIMYLTRNAFVSLIDKLPGKLKRLEPPQIIRGVKLPLACAKRSPA